MDNVQIVKDITNAFCENKLDDKVLEQYFAKDFEHVVNGRHTDLKGYAEHLADYMREYRRFRIPAWDELFAAGDRVVSSYTLQAERPNGEKMHGTETAVLVPHAETCGKSITGSAARRGLVSRA